MPIKVFDIKGKRPSVTPRLLPVGYAQVAANVRLGSGAAENFAAPGNSVYTPASGASCKTIYKFGGNWFDWSARRWIEKAAISGTDRMLVSDGSTYPKTLTPAGLARRWGVIKPTGDLTPTLEGVAAEDAAVEDTVSYVYTLVTADGEESDVSDVMPPIDVYAGQSISLTGWCVHNGNRATWLSSTGNDIVGIRVYRLNSDAAGNAEYQRVFLRPTAGGAAVDQLSVSAISGATDAWFDHNPAQSGLSQDLGAMVVTEGWDPPPTGMKGAVMFANGMYAGWIGNLLYIAMPGYYYAFPATGDMDYTMELAYDVVAAAAFNESLVVGTTGYPEVVSGTDAAFMSRTPLPFQQPCLSTKGMVALPDGVAYPSPDGLFFISSAGGHVLTQNVMTREQWRALSLSAMICVYYDQRIFMFFEGSDDGLIYDRDLDYLVDIVACKTIKDVFLDPVSDLMYLADAYGVYAWEGAASAKMTSEWKSGILETPPVNFPALRVEGTFPAGHSTTLYYYVDGVLKHTQTVENDQPFRLPAGFLGRDHEIRLLWTGSTLNAFYLGTSIEDLKNV